MSTFIFKDGIPESEYRARYMKAILRPRMDRLYEHLQKFPDDQQGVSRFRELEKLAGYRP